MEPLRGDETPVDPEETGFATRGRRLDDAPVLAVLSDLDRPTVAWSEGEERVVAGGAAATLTADGSDRFERVRDAAAALFAGRAVETELPRFARPRLFGGFAFHERNGDDAGDQWAGFPDAEFVLPEILVADRDGETWLVANATGPDAAADASALLDRWADRIDGFAPLSVSSRPGIASRTYAPDEDGWRRQIEAAVDRIQAGTLRKVVLAQALTVELDTSLSVPAAYGRLGATYPECYRFAFAPDGAGWFFGATPERLVTRRGRTVRTEALAGSTGRGDTPAEDEWLARELQDSAKDSHEHELVVSAIKDQLSPFARSISTSDRTVKRLASVQHLQTPITADLSEDYHVLSLVKALHPTPAVGGLPPDEALRTIRETEVFDRGWYAAPVGWFDAEGDGTFAVAIRSAVADGEQATLFAGNGIVGDSDPDREWEEVQLKYSPILDTLE